MEYLPQKGMNKMKILFLLPKYSRFPIGGYKIIFEYANRLYEENNDVVIMFDNSRALKNIRIPSMIKKIVSFYFTKREPRWFDLHKGISKVSLFDKNINDDIYNNIDVVFATAVSTALIVSKNFNCARKYYLIQDFENWYDSEELVYKSYGLGMTNIVISKWLQELVDKYSRSPSKLISNPIDLSIYYPKKSIEKRDCNTIALLYHDEPHKGLKYALEAIDKVKRKIPDLRVKMFGVPDLNDEVPEYIEYTRNASLNQTVEIYNSVAIFVCATIEEGFGLTGLESMACGAALVSTSYKGVLEYAIDGYNALLSPVCDVTALEKNILELIQNNEKRIEIAQNGVKSVAHLSWDEAMKLLNGIIS